MKKGEGVEKVDVRDITNELFFFCFLDRAFSIMKTKNKPTKCTN